MLNRVILIGRLTKDPSAIYSFRCCCNAIYTCCRSSVYRTRREREADFIPVVTWRQLAETCANYLRKGRLTAVEGRIQVRNYENNEGKRVYVTEVIADNVRFLESNRETSGGGGNREESSFSGGSNSNSSGGNRGNNNYSRNNNQDPFSDEGKPIDISDDDLPF